MVLKVSYISELRKLARGKRTVLPKRMVFKAILQMMRDDREAQEVDALEVLYARADTRQ